MVSSHEDIWAIGERVTEQEADWARSQVRGKGGGNVSAPKRGGLMDLAEKRGGWKVKTNNNYSAERGGEGRRGGSEIWLNFLDGMEAGITWKNGKHEGERGGEGRRRR